MVERFKEHLRDCSRSENTINLYGRVVGVFLDWLDGRHIDVDIISEYQRKLVASGSASATARTRAAAIRTFVRWAKQETDLVDDGTISKFPPLPRTHTIPPNVALDSDIDLMLPCLHDKYKLALLLMADTGIRVGEVEGLCWADVDWDRKSMRVKRKGGRVQELPWDTSNRLIDALLGASKQGKYVISGTNRDKIASGAIGKAFKQACAAANIHHRTPHSFRHCFAHRQARAGVSTAIIRKVLGHSSLATTQIYLAEVGSDVDELRENLVGV